MSVSPRLTKQRNPLSLEDLDHSAESSDDAAQVTQIRMLEQQVKLAQREKRQLEITIEGLEHDLLCAQKARELGNHAALGVAKRLAALFGEALKDEDLVQRIQQLQERARAAREAVESLKNEAVSLRISTPIQGRDTQRRVDSANDEIAILIANEKNFEREIHELQRECESRERLLLSDRTSASELQRKLALVLGGSNWNEAEVRDKIVRHSEEFLLDQCERIARTVGIQFDPRMDSSIVLGQLKKQFVDLRQRLSPSLESETKFTTTAKQSEDAISQIVALHREMKELTKQCTALRNEVAIQEPPRLEDFTLYFKQEKHQMHRRLHVLRGAMSKVLIATDSKCEVPTSQSEVCASYNRLVSSIREEIQKLQNEDPSAVDVGGLQLKAEAVRRQNRLVRTKLRTL
jgi:hypothetical protein